MCELNWLHSVLILFFYFPTALKHLQNKIPTNAKGILLSKTWPSIAMVLDTTN